MKRAMVGAGLVVCTSMAVFGQPAGSSPAFEVASVKPAPPQTGGFFRVGMGGDPGRVNYSNVTLKDVMSRAYSVKDNQISGPGWLDSERYDIVATVPTGTPKEQIPLMLQTLLAERFHLAVHREQKVMPVYALVAAKSGSKLHAAEAAGGIRMSMGPKGRQMTGKGTMANLTDALSRMMDRPVLDMTGIEGAFDIDIEWTPDDSQPNRMPGGLPIGPGPRPEGGGEGKLATDSADRPSIFTALQEKLGLKLEARKLPVDIVIVDHAEKVPTEN